MWKWAAAASLLLLFAVLWLTRGSATARAPRAGPAEHPAPPDPPLVVPQKDAAAASARGVVVDEDGRPIAGAVVQWRSKLKDGPVARTADDGTFGFEQALPSEGVYAVEARGYAGRWVEAGSERIVLRRGGTRRVVARVVDEDRRPVEGATGEVFLAGSYGRAVSDAAGALEIGGLFPYGEEPGGLLVRAKGHVPEAVQLGTLLEDVDAGTVVLSRGGVVTGVVRDESTGSPVPGARVGYASFLWDWEAVADADGSFRLEAVSLDAFCLYAYADGWLPSRQGWGPSATGRKLFDEQREIVRDVLVVRSVTVAGIVLDDAGAPVANASVEVNEPEESPRVLVPGLASAAPTDAKGAFAVAGFHPGSALTMVAASESGIAEHEARAGEGPVVLRLEPTRPVVGRVLNGRGEPVVKAELTAGPPDKEEETGPSRVEWAWTDEEGRFAFSHVRPGAWSLAVEAKGLVTLRTTIDVAAGTGEVDLGDVALGLGNSLAGVVVDPAGAPLEGVRVRAESDEERAGGERHGRAVTDAEGRFRIEGLHDGEFEIEASRRGRSRVLGAATSGSAGLRLVMPEAATARGRVLGGDAPLSDADVRAAGGDASPVGPDGTFEVSDLEPGQRFTLTILHTLYKTLAQQIEPWEGIRDFRLEEGRFFEGTVVDERGRPLAEMGVEVSTEGHEDRHFVESGPDGHWRVGGLEGGQIVVHLFPGVGYAFEEPVEIAPGVTSCQLVARKGYEIRGTVRRKDGGRVEDASVTVFRADGSKVSAGFSWEGRSRFSTTELVPGKYKLVVSGYSKGEGGVLKEHYGEATVEVTNPGPDVEVVLPK